MSHFQPKQYDSHTQSKSRIRLFKVPYFSVRLSRSSAGCNKLVGVLVSCIEGVGVRVL